jgi:hypothetical protein
MASSGAKLAIVPLAAVAVVLAASGIHGRRTHDPERAARALELLAPTDNARVAKAELAAFFETGWVGWDVKTDIELRCGNDRARSVPDPPACLTVARDIVLEHEQHERAKFRTYTFLAWSSLAPGLAALVLGLMQIARRRARKEPAV